MTISRQNTEGPDYHAKNGLVVNWRLGRLLLNVQQKETPVTQLLENTSRIRMYSAPLFQIILKIVPLLL